jgi:hypothetical protein
MLRHNILAVVLGLKHGKYQLGTANGIPLRYFAFNQLSKAPGIPTLHSQDAPDDEPKSLREVARIESVTGGQRILKGDCKGGCKTNRCKCKQAKMLCNSRCHHSATFAQGK